MRTSEHVALAVGGGDVVLRVRLDADGEDATVDVHVGDVDEVRALDGILEVLTSELAFEVEDDGLAGAELELGDLVAVAVRDVVHDAAGDAGHHGVGIDLDPDVTEEAVDAPLATVELGALRPEEVDGVAVELVVHAGELAGCHFNAFSYTFGGYASRIASVCFSYTHKMRGKRTVIRLLLTLCYLLVNEPRSNSILNEW